MGFVFDIITVTIIIVLAVICAKQGFVRSLITLCGCVLALLFTYIVSVPAANFLYKNVAQKPVQSAISKNMEGFAADTADTAAAIERGLDGLIGPIKALLPEQGQDTVDKLAADLQGGTQQFASALEENVVAPVVTSLLHVLCFVVIFALALILVRLVARVGQVVNYIPVVGGFNRVLGAALGVLQGAFWVYLLAILVWVLLALSQNAWPVLNGQTVESSWLFSWFYHHQPFYL